MVYTFRGQAHNLKAASSNLAPATKYSPCKLMIYKGFLFVFIYRFPIILILYYTKMGSTQLAHIARTNEGTMERHKTLKDKVKLYRV